MMALRDGWVTHGSQNTGPKGHDIGGTRDERQLKAKQEVNTKTQLIN
jgi:hypothetical protein